MVDSVSFGPARQLSALHVKRAGQDMLLRHPSTNARQTDDTVAVLARRGPPHDVDKITILRAAIASGAYTVSLGDIADAILRFGGGDPS
jgi:anti-sigma28 factor (negative regulator of flagellin synthesis)